MIQSPPELLNIYELFCRIGMERNQREIALGNFEYNTQKKPQSNIPDLTPSCYPKLYFIPSLTNLKILRDALNQDFRLSSHDISLDMVQLEVYESGNHKLLDNPTYKKSFYVSPSVSSYIEWIETAIFARHSLSNGDLKSYISYNLIYSAIPKEFWHNDEGWYRLLADGFLYGLIPSIDLKDVSGVVYFKEREVDNFFLKKESDKNAPVTDDERLTEKLLKKIKDGNTKLRGAEKLYFLTKNSFDEDGISHESNTKVKLVHKIYSIAKTHGFKIVKNPQQEFTQTKLTKEQVNQVKKELNENGVTAQEIENIAGLIVLMYKD